LFGVLGPFISVHSDGNAATNDVAAQAAVDIWSIIERNRKVGYWEDLDAQRRTMNDIDDYLYDEIKDSKGLPLTTIEMDGIIERAMQVARHRMVN
jgi:type I restriction enzyme, R subunit